MPDQNDRTRYTGARQDHSTIPPELVRRAAIMDFVALIVIVIGVTVAVAGVYIVFGIGASLITTGVALVALGVALAYR